MWRFGGATFWACIPMNFALVSHLAGQVVQLVQAATLAFHCIIQTYMCVYLCSSCLAGVHSSIAIKKSIYHCHSWDELAIDMSRSIPSSKKLFKFALSSAECPVACIMTEPHAARVTDSCWLVCSSYCFSAPEIPNPGAARLSTHLLGSELHKDFNSDSKFSQFTWPSS